MNKIKVLLVTGFSLFTFIPGFTQLNTGTGDVWGTLAPAEPMLLNEKFQGFGVFHSDKNANEGNSDNVIGASGDVVFGYKNDTVDVPIIGYPAGKIRYYYYQCAFAPNWLTAYAFRDSLGTGSGANSANVSRGFVEISRTYATSGSNAPTVHGWFIVDLRALEFVEVVQWSHSSTGGNKRGVMCEFSIDDGKTWDTLRYQPGTNYAGSFTKDVATGKKTSNGFRCDPSAYGMTWEEGIYSEKIMLRFGEAGGQTPRLHDLKVFGTYSPQSSARKVNQDGPRIFYYHNKVTVNTEADVTVYDLTGKLLLAKEKTRSVVLNQFSPGIYIVKAMAGNLVTSEKIAVR